MLIVSLWAIMLEERFVKDRIIELNVSLNSDMIKERKEEGE